MLCILKEIVGNVMYLNLDRRSDRRLRMESLFREMGVYARRIPAVDGRLLEQKVYPNNRNAAEVACLMGHTKMWMHAASAETPSLIAEDDWVVCHRFLEYWQNKVLDLPDDIDMLMLGVSWPGKVKQISGSLATMDSFLGAFAQVIWPAGAKKMLQAYQKNPNCPADWYAKELNAKGLLKVFVVMPTWVVVQQDGDIALRANAEKRFGKVWEDFGRNF